MIFESFWLILNNPDFWSVLFVLGLVFGAGAGLLTQIFYFLIIQDRLITLSELRFLEVGSYISTGGLGLIIFSLLGLVETLDLRIIGLDARILVIISLTGFLILNYLVFYSEVLAILRRLVGVSLRKSKEWRQKSILLYAVGAIVFTSWVFLVIVSGVSQLAYSYGIIMLLYLLVLAIALTLAFVARVDLLNDK